MNILETMLQHKELAIQIAKDGAVQAFLKSIRVIPVILILKPDGILESHIIASSSDDEARNTIVKLLQVNNINTYLFIGSGQVRVTEDAFENLSEEYEDMLIVAFIENGGAVEQYICPVRNIKEAHKKNTLSDLQWKRRQIFSVGNVIVREW